MENDDTSTLFSEHEKFMEDFKENEISYPSKLIKFYSYLNSINLLGNQIKYYELLEYPLYPANNDQKKIKEQISDLQFCEEFILYNRESMLAVIKADTGREQK